MFSVFFKHDIVLQLGSFSSYGFSLRNDLKYLIHVRISWCGLETLALFVITVFILPHVLFNFLDNFNTYDSFYTCDSIWFLLMIITQATNAESTQLYSIMNVNSRPKCSVISLSVSYVSATHLLEPSFAWGKMCENGVFILPFRTSR